jgi:hypothetical protein
MSRCLIKCDRGVDLYVQWSTVVDNVTAIGPRGAWEALGVHPARLIRADTIGTSSHCGLGQFHESVLVVGNLQRLPREAALPPREHLMAYALGLAAGDYERAESPTLLLAYDTDASDEEIQRMIADHRSKCALCARHNN